jgi:hypothetical protein
MLKSIAIVTLVVQHLATVSTAYQEHLGYREAGHGSVTAELAGAWDAGAMAGREYTLLQPASGAAVYLRFIEAPPGMLPVPALRTHGWNATELLVEDPDALIRRLDGTPFRVIGAPANLTAGENAPRAAQVVGPAGEVLYLTRIIPGGTGFDLGSARTPVDRVFIAVVGGPSIDALRAWYGGTLGLPLSDNFHWPIKVLARAHGLPPDTVFPLAVAILPKDFLVEVDEYPAGAKPRPRLPGALPGGMAMVSFTTESLDRPGLRWRAAPRVIGEFPYGGRRVAVTEGPAGEWLELLEDRGDAPP